MFTTPIRRVELSTLEEVKNFSEQVYGRRTDQRKVYYQNNGQIAFVDEMGFYYVTPYRTEIHSILGSSGYKEYGIFVPNSNGEHTSARYVWLRQMADRENWALTHEEAHEIATKKGLKEVTLPGSYKQYQYKEIKEYCNDEKWVYTPMVMMFLSNSSKDYIGTYIIVDSTIILACDEYGRTFKITAHTQHIFNSVVNALIDAGYKPNHQPEYFVHEYVKPTVPNEEKDLTNPVEETE